jgi:tetratricopeptide (TPR) repeat protein
MSWFSSWTTATKTAGTESAPSSSIVIHDEHAAEILASLPSRPSSHQTSPAKSIKIDRGMSSSKEEEIDRICNPHETVPSRHYQKRLQELAASGGCMPMASRNDSKISPLWTISSRTVKPIKGDVNEIDNNLPLPPYVNTSVTKTKHLLKSASQKVAPLLEEFPPSQPAVVDMKSTSDAQQSPPQRISDEEVISFPGFALYERAKAQYYQGFYSQALDTTTECLAFQKSFLNERDVGPGNSLAAVASINSAVGPIHATASTGIVPDIISGVNGGASTTTPMLYRSSFVTHVGSSVLGAVLSLKPDSSRELRPNDIHPMLTNSIGRMISQYPSHHCIVKTLLLRGRVLAACGLDKRDNDLSLIVQAARNVEMAVTIQRKLIIDEELAAPLLFLGILKTRLGRFDEAEMAYREAVDILSDIRSNAKSTKLEALKSEDPELFSDCAMRCTVVTRGMARAFYLRGKAYHCQKKFIPAFHHYNKALNLSRNTGPSPGGFDVRNIARCMKNSYALEKLVSSHWDDKGAV